MPNPTQSSSVQVGVGVLVIRGGQVLLGQRLGSHGAGTWAAPGGHLEFGEEVEACARRETLEETGLQLTTVTPGPFANTVFADVQRHYVTCFVEATIDEAAVAQAMEPHKCAQWQWFDWAALPEPLFAPLRNLLDSGYRPSALATPPAGA